jgi:diguanylate cyclase (GGDEF)-like protein
MMSAHQIAKRSMRLVPVDGGGTDASAELATELAAQLLALRAANARLREENEELRGLAMIDPLTKLYNRRGLDTELERALSTSRRSTAPVALLLIDLDGLKQVNDLQGHPEGDRVLRAVGQVLRQSIRAADSAARLGGDEFAVVMPSTDLDGAKVVAERIRMAIAALGLPGVTASIGVATFAGGASQPDTLTQLVSAADGALYSAKRTGKNKVVVTP